MSHCVKRCLETRAESTSVARHTEKSEGGLLEVVQKNHVGYPAAETPYDEAIAYPPTLPLGVDDHTHVEMVVEFERRLGHVCPEILHPQLFQDFHRVHQTWNRLEQSSLKTRCDGEAWVCGRPEGYTGSDIAAVQEKEWGRDDGGGGNQEEEVGEMAKDTLHCRGTAAWSNPARGRCRLKRAGFINGLGIFNVDHVPRRPLCEWRCKWSMRISKYVLRISGLSTVPGRLRGRSAACDCAHCTGECSDAGLTTSTRTPLYKGCLLLDSIMEFCYGILSWQIFGHWRSMRWSWRF